MERRKLPQGRIRSEKLLPDLELEKYTCEACEQFTFGGSQPFFRALSAHGEHNKVVHPKEFPPPKITMVYKT